MKKKDIQKLIESVLSRSLSKPLEMLDSRGWMEGPIRVFGTFNPSRKPTYSSPGEDSSFEVSYIVLPDGKKVSEEEFIDIENKAREEENLSRIGLVPPVEPMKMVTFDSFREKISSDTQDIDNFS